MKCKLEFIYYVTKKPSNYVSMHKHECYELVYYIKGSGSSEINDIRYSYAPSTFALIRPDIYHDEDHREDTNVLYIGFSFDSPGFTLENGIYPDDSHRTILTFLQQLKKELAEKQKHYELKLDLVLKELLIEFERMQDSSKGKCSDFTYIRRFIEENFNQTIDLHVLADLSGYSYHHFRHLFKEKTGFSPMDYIIRQRTHHARKLLAETTLSMAAISQECGFSTESQFSSLFKRLIGQTPSDYRKRCKT